MKKELWVSKPDNLFIASLVTLVFSSLSLFLLRFLATGTLRYWFLMWNLLLSVMPLCFALLLDNNFKNNRWLSGKNLLFTILWLSFLPNSFYIISDLIHLRSTGEISVLFDAVLITSFVICGLVFGMMSVYIIHKQLLNRLSPLRSNLLISAVLLLSSFAIYLGRYLRWNSWDVALSPAGIIYDVSDRIINPVANVQTFGITLTFFIVLISTYFFTFSAINYLKEGKL